MEATYYSGLNNTPTQWNDNYCNTSKCYFCTFTSVPTFILRGMSFCQTEHFDQRYKWTPSLQDNRYVLLGLRGSRIAWTEANQTWTISSRFSKEARTIYLQSSRTVYPGGLQYWVTDHHCGFTTERTEVLLHLTACGEENYNCHDGTCVNIAARCDKNNDCPDASDEKNCTLLITNPSYDPHVAPTTPGDNVKNPIEIHITILKILKTQIVDQKIKIQFSLSMTWYDSRLLFKNLKVRLKPSELHKAITLMMTL